MLLQGCQISIFTILLTAAIAVPYPEEDKTFNLKVGFDLTHGNNGAPSLRIRDFEESKEFSPRADEDDKEKEKSVKPKKKHAKVTKKTTKVDPPAVRAGSNSNEYTDNEDTLDKSKAQTRDESRESKKKPIRADPSKSDQSRASDGEDTYETDTDAKKQPSTRGPSEGGDGNDGDDGNYE